MINRMSSVTIFLRALSATERFEIMADDILKKIICFYVS